MFSLFWICASTNFDLIYPLTSCCWWCVFWSRLHGLICVYFILLVASMHFGCYFSNTSRFISLWLAGFKVKKLSRHLNWKKCIVCISKKLKLGTPIMVIVVCGVLNSCIKSGKDSLKWRSAADGPSQCRCVTCWVRRSIHSVCLGKDQIHMSVNGSSSLDCVESPLFFQDCSNNSCVGVMQI